MINEAVLSESHTATQILNVTEGVGGEGGGPGACYIL